MNPFVEFLRENPLVAILLIGWVMSAIGGAITKAKKQLPRRGPGTHPQPTPTQRSEPASTQRPQPKAAARPAPTAARRQAPQSADEVAREMRRILGLEPAPSRPRTEPAKPSRPAASDAQRRKAAEPERASQPFTPSTLGTVASRVQPHVGEDLTRRRAPTSGAVSFGELGGRQAAVRQTSRPTTRLVDLRNLTRAIILKEILGPPKSLE